MRAPRTAPDDAHWLISCKWKYVAWGLTFFFERRPDRLLDIMYCGGILTLIFVVRRTCSVSCVPLRISFSLRGSFRLSPARDGYLRSGGHAQAMPQSCQSLWEAVIKLTTEHGMTCKLCQYHALLESGPILLITNIQSRVRRFFPMCGLVRLSGDPSLHNQPFWMPGDIAAHRALWPVISHTVANDNRSAPN